MVINGGVRRIIFVTGSFDLELIPTCHFLLNDSTLTEHRNRPHADSDMPKAFISLSEDAHLVSLGKRIIKSRRSLMGTKQVKAKAKSADTILFRDLDMDIKDIICS